VDGPFTSLDLSLNPGHVDGPDLFVYLITLLSILSYVANNFYALVDVDGPHRYSDLSLFPGHVDDPGLFAYLIILLSIPAIIYPNLIFSPVDCP
jgi:hypothetical protein